MIKNLNDLIRKVEDLKTKGPDLSLEEDLSIAVMNLISLEEHFFFTGQKTKKDDYLKLMGEVRSMRKKLMARMINKHEGETWCAVKHLLASSMRLIEVGTKLQSNGSQKDAKEMFKNAFALYSMFWSLRLNLIKLPQLKDAVKDKPWSLQEIVNKLVDCCKE